MSDLLGKVDDLELPVDQNFRSMPPQLSMDEYIRLCRELFPLANTEAQWRRREEARCLVPFEL